MSGEDRPTLFFTLMDADETGIELKEKMNYRYFCVLLAGAVMLGGTGCSSDGNRERQLSRASAETVVSRFPAFFPKFSWDTVPVYQMFADKRLLTDTEAGEIASTTEFICIEKQHGIQSHGAADIGAKEEIQKFKALKPGIKSLVYYNSAYAYPFTSFSKGFHHKQIDKPENAKFKSYLITDQKTGELTFRGGDHTHHFDVLKPELRDWWVQSVADFVRDADADGLFVDQMHGFSWLRPGQKAEVEAAQAEMMRRAKEAIGKESILLLNNAARIPALFEIGDAFMFEHYSSKLLTKEEIVDDWALMKKISDAGKISVWRIGIEHDGAIEAMKTEGQKVESGTLEAVSRDRIYYYLAAFLIGAQ